MTSFQTRIGSGLWAPISMGSLKEESMKRLKNRSLASTAIVLMLSMLVFPFLVPVANAQATTGSLRGVVSDDKNAVIPDADVTAKNVATGIETKTRTNNEGLYNLPRLL